MHIAITGKHMEIGSTLHDRVEAEIRRIVPKYLEQAPSASVVLTKEGPLFRADIVINPGTHSGVVIKGRADDADAYAACNSALHRIEKQLRRYKGRLHDRHEARATAAATLPAMHYTLNSDSETEPTDDHTPLVVAEQPTHIDTLTVSEAVMRLDLEDLPAILFHNAKHGQLNVVYRRPDGHIAWVDPQERTQEASKAA